MLSKGRTALILGRRILSHNFAKSVDKYAYAGGGRCPATLLLSFCKERRFQKLHTSCTRQGLMEFFDDSDNWEKMVVPVGRSWEKKVLRTRSNEELHKLWYVLLKEMNMLLTMKAEYDRLFESFPNAERLEKVEVSMDNLRDVVDERNSVYSVLETGEEPHPRWIDDTDELNRPIRRLEEEYIVPKEHNEEFLKKYDNLGDWTRPYMRHWNEKIRNQEFYYGVRWRVLRKKLIQKYPHLADEENKEYLEQYCRDKTRPYDPNPDVEQLINESKNSD